jgi:hypothetical protein|tara:strand:- start:4758 stop:5591 length:834 start_codon:yes stop_codon:yes gene_type:complete
MKICIYSNCQRWGIVPNLKRNIKGVEISEIENYTLIRKKKPLPINVISECDVFIYQPIRKEHGIYSTNSSKDQENVVSYLKSDCLKISFPYIYNSGIWCLVRGGIEKDDGSTQGNRDVIKALSKDHTLSEIINLYRRNEIDYNYKNRFETSLDNLKRRERDCNIIVSELIESNIRKHKLFYTQNHPTPFVFDYVCKQILDLIRCKYPDYISKNYTYVTRNLLCKNKGHPVSRSDILYWNFEYIKTEDESADEYYIDLITQYYNNVRKHDQGIPDVYY